MERQGKRPKVHAKQKEFKNFFSRPWQFRVLFLSEIGTKMYKINFTSAETLIPIGLGNAKSHQHLKATEQLEIRAEP